MLKQPFLFLAIVLIVTSGLLYPSVCSLVVFWATGVLFCIVAAVAPRRHQVCLDLMTYLGIILTLHGILLGWDSSLGGAPPNAEMKAEYVGQLHGRRNHNPVDLASYFFAFEKCP